MTTHDNLKTRLLFTLRDWKVDDRHHFPPINALLVHEAVARIEELEAALTRQAPAVPDDVDEDGLISYLRWYAYDVAGKGGEPHPKFLEAAQTLIALQARIAALVELLGDAKDMLSIHGYDEGPIWDLITVALSKDTPNG